MAAWHRSSAAPARTHRATARTRGRQPQVGVLQVPQHRGLSIRHRAVSRLSPPATLVSGYSGPSLRAKQNWLGADIPYCGGSPSDGRTPGPEQSQRHMGCASTKGRNSLTSRTTSSRRRAQPATMAPAIPVSVRRACSPPQPVRARAPAPLAAALRAPQACSFLGHHGMCQPQQQALGIDEKVPNVGVVLLVRLIGERELVTEEEKISSV